jgi:2-polyprenyl-6-methoxyphenol hydroxylase-like FAD-dependent oxidoreductase
VRHVDKYQKGNIFLAGDAAHAYPPAGVQGGMNLGIKDACSLARRIAEGDTKGYTKERRAEAEGVIREAKMMVSIAGMKNSFMQQNRRHRHAHQGDQEADFEKVAGGLIRPTPSARCRALRTGSRSA